MDQGIWPLLPCVPNIPLLGLYLHNSKIKTEVSRLITKEARHVWPSLTSPNDDADLQPSHF